MIRPESSSPRTLIADDQPDVLEALNLLLKREGYQIETVNSPKAVLERSIPVPDRKVWICWRACKSSTIRCQWW